MLDTIQLVASGDSRPEANRQCWPAQAALERVITDVFRSHGATLQRSHAFDARKGHGFIDGQARGIEVFRTVRPDVPIVIATAVWQYSSHVLPGLSKHRGPILTLGNWSGEWPGLVGLLNLNGCLTKAGIRYSTIWSRDFSDDFARNAIAEWLSTGRITHDVSHATVLNGRGWSSELMQCAEIGQRLGRTLKRDQALIGVFDEGCMGMYNAIIPDELLHRTGVFKERFSQSSLYAAMLAVPDATARDHYRWLCDRGMRFKFGSDPATELTEAQVLEGLKMYDVAARLAHAYGCDAIGIQYQQGLQDLCVSSDLCEGLLNNPDRPPVRADDGRVVFKDRAIPHFNEADECAGLDALLTHRVWTELGLDPSTTLHDIRWGEDVRDCGVDEFVWVFEISGAVPASHLVDGYRGAIGERQPPVYFPRGGATLKGVSRPGEIVWSRIYVEDHALHMDIGRGGVVHLSAEIVEHRWAQTTPQWPMMNAVLYGVSRDQLMAKHQANHIQVAYASNAFSARQAMVMKAVMAQELGIHVNLCGDMDDNLLRHQDREFLIAAGYGGTAGVHRTAAHGL